YQRFVIFLGVDDAEEKSHRRVGGVRQSGGRGPARAAVDMRRAVSDHVYLRRGNALSLQKVAASLVLVHHDRLGVRGDSAVKHRGPPPERQAEAAAVDRVQSDDSREARLAHPLAEANATATRRQDRL